MFAFIWKVNSDLIQYSGLNHKNSVNCLTKNIKISLTSASHLAFFFLMLQPFRTRASWIPKRRVLFSSLRLISYSFGHFEFFFSLVRPDERNSRLLEVLSGYDSWSLDAVLFVELFSAYVAHFLVINNFLSIFIAISSFKFLYFYIQIYSIVCWSSSDQSFINSLGIFLKSLHLSLIYTDKQSSLRFCFILKLYLFSIETAHFLLAASNVYKFTLNFNCLRTSLLSNFHFSTLIRLEYKEISLKEEKFEMCFISSFNPSPVIWLLLR